MRILVPIVHGRFPIIVLVAVALHLIWALGLSIDSAAHDATAVHALLLLTKNSLWAASILTGVALSAFLGCTWRWQLFGVMSRVWRALLILPQQCILIMSSIGALDAMLNSTFADGVIRPRWFIVVDQIPVVLITIGHFTALAHIARDK